MDTKLRGIRAQGRERRKRVGGSELEKHLTFATSLPRHNYPKRKSDRRAE